MRRLDPIIRERSTTLCSDRWSVFAFDLEGRPVSWFERDRVFKRSLASAVYGRERVGGRRRYWRLSDDDAAEAFDGILRAVARAPLDRLDEQGVERIERILSWTPERLAAERGRFDAAYRPISILPPDQYLAVVLQASFGCSWNQCTFCCFYQDRSFSTRSERGFREHCHDVGELLGRGAALRRRIFLADGNSLTLSNRRLLPIFEIARDAFPGRGLYGFVDVFTGEKKSLDDWSELLGAGLKRVHVGIETGDDRLLGWLNKPGSADDALEFVGTLKRAGLRVSVILMVGAGGERFSSDHVRRSLELTARLPLDEGDVVYLSPFLEHEGSAYARRAREEGLRALDRDEIESQYVELRDGIRQANPRIRVTRYDIREFVY
jgi:radical SAM superfamily enzyme YgiQ (UPF0313 family)